MHVVNTVIPYVMGEYSNPICENSDPIYVIRKSAWWHCMIQVRSVLRFCSMLSLTFQTHTLTWISWVKYEGHCASQGNWTLLFSFVSHTLVPNGQPMLKQGLLWCCCWCCRSCCCCLPLPLLLLLSLLSWFSVMHVCHYVVRLSTRYMCGYSHTGFAALAPMIRLWVKFVYGLYQE